MKPEALDAVVFDVIGTLVDEDATWASAAARIAAETGSDGTVDLLAGWAAALDLRMSAVVEGDEPWRPHRELVVESARAAVSTAGGELTAADAAQLAEIEAGYPAWPDVASATAALRRNRLVAGLSNGDLDSLARLANTNRISWDIALSTGSVRTFKPAPAAYRHAIDALRIEPTRTLFVAAHPWDLRAAAAFGFRTAYIARPGAERPSKDDRFDLQLEDLDALVDYLDGGDPRRPL
ncbi:haloacid dehalogenase type II [Amnibacterium flavum]|uniref:haloacid dehalogenase type II n=1 Tax=Amnibacterium flavum TaxID=2173173 RepID=UPI00140393B9|nr:haloacid dehalogenase type II [Amnibacterium flavum]